MATDYERIASALAEAQARQCAHCQAAPRAKGDHYCAPCRRRFDEARAEYERAKEKSDAG